MSWKPALKVSEQEQEQEQDAYKLIDASPAMQTGEVITVDTFTLQDAMSAVEVLDC